MEYACKITVRRNGEFHAPGATIDLDRAEAGRLLEIGAIEPLAAKRDAAPGGDSERERVALLAEVVRSLDPRDKDNFTRDGKPRTEALEADDRIGFPVSAALRDRALDTIGSKS